jgi:hypothetical protein
MVSAQGAKHSIEIPVSNDNLLVRRGNHICDERGLWGESMRETIGVMNVNFAEKAHNDNWKANRIARVPARPWFLSAVFTMGIVTSCVAQSDLPVQRSVNGNVLTSDVQPRANVSFNVAFHYAGSQRFLLYGVAEAEQHFFVDADPDKRIRSFYWLQFEHYLDGNNEHYNYSPTHVIEIGGLSFICDTKIYTDYTALRPSADSDSARGRALLSGKGYVLPAAAIRARLIHLPDSSNRSEFMIIYLEALAPSQLPPDAKNEMAADIRFPELSALILKHAKQNLSISRPR